MGYLSGHAASGAILMWPGRKLAVCYDEQAIGLSSRVGSMTNDTRGQDDWQAGVPAIGSYREAASDACADGDTQTRFPDQSQGVWLGCLAEQGRPPIDDRTRAAVLKARSKGESFRAITKGFHISKCAVGLIVGEAR